MAKSYEELKNEISAITNEVEDGANTANRIGGAMADIADFAKESLEAQEERINEETDIKISGLVVQETGDGEGVVMSQKAVTGLDSKMSVSFANPSIPVFNIDTVEGTVVVLSNIYWGYNSGETKDNYIPKDTTFTIKPNEFRTNVDVKGGLVKFAFDINSSAITTLHYLDKLKASEIIIGMASSKYGDTYTSFNWIHFNNELKYTIDGKDIDRQVFHEAYWNEEAYSLYEIDSKNLTFSVKGETVLYYGTTYTQIPKGTTLSCKLFVSGMSSGNNRIIFNIDNQTIYPKNYTEKLSNGEVVLAIVMTSYADDTEKEFIAVGWSGGALSLDGTKIRAINDIHLIKEKIEVTYEGINSLKKYLKSDFQVYTVNAGYSDILESGGNRIRMIFRAYTRMHIRASMPLGKGFAMGVYDTFEHALLASGSTGVIEKLGDGNYHTYNEGTLGGGFLSVSLSKSDSTAFTVEEINEYVGALTLEMEDFSLHLHNSITTADRLGIWGDYADLSSVKIDTKALTFSIIGGMTFFYNKKAYAFSSAKTYTCPIYVAGNPSSYNMIICNIATDTIYPKNYLEELSADEVMLAAITTTYGSDETKAFRYVRISGGALDIDGKKHNCFIDVENRLKNVEVKLSTSSNNMLERIKNSRYVAHSPKIKSLGLVHITDAHGDTEAINTVNDFTKNFSSLVDDVICTGDSTHYYYNSTPTYPNGYEWWVGSELGKKSLFVLGNHDAATEQSTEHDVKEDSAAWNGMGKDWSYETYFKPFLESWGVTAPDGIEDPSSPNYHACYWHKDYVNQKIRLIGLDCINRYDGGFKHATREQEDWLEARLAETLNPDSSAYGYAVIFMCHYPLDDFTGLNEQWNNDSHRWEYNKNTTGGAVVNHRTNDRVNFHEQTMNSYTAELKFNMRTREVSETSYVGYVKGSVNPIGDIIDSWTQLGGVAIAWLCGHMHTDMFYYPTKYSNILCVANDQCGNLRGNNLTDRSSDLATHTCANYYAIDTENGLFKVIRIGLTVNRLMTSKEVLCYDYKNKIVISEY